MDPQAQKEPSNISIKTADKNNKDKEPKQENGPKRPSKESERKPEKENVNLVQDFFGFYYFEDGGCVKIKRFTWTNQNRIQVQVINYGARIVSIKFPDRKGNLDDIVLGFDDLAGYLYFKKHCFGATIGRMTNVVKNSTFNIGKKHFFLKPNTKNGDHQNGGTEGFDQVIWKTFIQRNKVIMSHMSPCGDQGYPGNLLVRISFELSDRNEFKIDMEAFTSKPTIINLSNLMYFNLAGHHTGPDSIYQHVVTMNCNCFTKQDDNGYCNGEVQNVVHTLFDFQIPKTLGKVMGIVPKDGFNQNLCVNRGVNQDDCFVARILHPPSGRFLEIYSNQCGVQFNTANHFGYGRILSLNQIMPSVAKETIKLEVPAEPEDTALKIIDYLHGKMLEELREEEETYYTGFREFVQILKKANYRNIPLNPTRISVTNRALSALRPSKVSVRKSSTVSFDDDLKFFTCTPKQMTYLKTLQTVLKGECFEETDEWLEGVLEKLICFATKNAEKAALPEQAPRLSNIESLHSSKTIASNQTSSGVPVVERKSVVEKSPSKKLSIVENSSLEKTAADKVTAEKTASGKAPSERGESGEIRKSEVSKIPDTIKLPEVLEEKKVVINNSKIPLQLPQVLPKKNVIPPYYKTCNEIIGKGRKLYKMHGGIALQTQNYPNCANIETFPNCVLNPGEKYKHTIVYKFWIRSGNPNRWIKRTMAEVAQINKI